MKDFKKMPKMACGGGVKKYSEGKEVEPSFLRTGKTDLKPMLRHRDKPDPFMATPVDMPSRLGAAKQSENTPISMPNRLGSSRAVNVPGLGIIERDEMQARKKGGKVKRGNKK
jgi:hypothetical protein